MQTNTFRRQNNRNVTTRDSAARAVGRATAIFKPKHPQTKFRGGAAGSNHPASGGRCKSPVSRFL